MAPFYKRIVTEVFSPEGQLIDFKFNVKDDFNFGYDFIDIMAEEEPDRLALLWINDKGIEKRITFSELKCESDKAAAFFLSTGIKKGDKVMLILKRHFEYWFCFIALHKIGAITIPATYQLVVKDLVYRFNTADVKAIVCTADGDVAEFVDEAQKSSPTLQTKIIVHKSREGWHNYEEAVNNAPEFVKPVGEDLPVGKDISLLFFTSGTTGMPKMVIHDFFYPLSHIFTAVYWHKVVDGGLHITVADTGWAKTAWGKMYGQWMAGSAQFVYDHDRFNAIDMLEKITKYKVTTFCAPPTIYRFFIKEDMTKYDFSSLTHATVAGEALNPEVFNRFLDVTGLKLMEGYGQTELMLLVFTPYYLDPKPGSMGIPVPYVDVDIVDDDGNSVQPGVNGEIVLRATREDKTIGMFIGYYNDEEMTNSIWHDGVYHTGDIAWKDEDGYYWYVSRKDDVIKSSGYRIGPFEVESVIMEHGAALECAVTGVPDPVRGQIIKATIVLANGIEPTEELKKDIQTYVKTHTAPYKYPRAIEFVDVLPKTISGKIRRVDIREKDSKIE